MKPIEAFLPEHEYAERHASTIRAAPEDVDRALREVCLADMPAARALVVLRFLPRRLAGGSPAAPHDVQKPFLDQVRKTAVVLEDVPGEGLTLGLTGQFWRLRGEAEKGPADMAGFLAYDCSDSCKAVMDFRVAQLGDGRSRLATETRVHVTGRQGRKAFRRYWRVVKPFSGLTRILMLRATQRRAEARS